MRNREDLIEDIKEAVTAFMTASAATRATPWLDLDLSLPQLKAIFALQHMGPVRVGEISHVLGLSPNATTAVLDRLEQHDLVSRQPDPADRRAVLVGLTRHGHEQVADLQSSNLRHLGDLLARLSEEELHALERGMSALNRVIRKGDRNQED